jgi:hypothetical protein
MQDRGYAPVLLRPGSVQPASAYWAEGEPQDVAGMLAMDPRCNLGWRLGVQPNGRRLLAVTASDAFWELARVLGDAPATWAQQAPGWAQHPAGEPQLVYQVPVGIELTDTIRTVNHHERVKCDGAYICIAPSELPGMGAYKVIERAPVAQLPERWLSALRKAPDLAPEALGEQGKKLERALKYTACCEPALSGSGGHRATLRVALKCVEFNLSISETMHVLRVFNERCQPKWKEKDLLHKAESAHGVGRVQRGGKLAAQAARSRMGAR